MEDIKDKNKIGIGIIEDALKQKNEIVILKNKNVFRDLRLFINALNKKFDFANKEMFIKDFIKFIHFDLSNNSAKDLELIESKFFEIIEKNSLNPDLKENLKKAGDELEKFIGGINKWQKK